MSPAVTYKTWWTAHTKIYWQSVSFKNRNIEVMHMGCIAMHSFKFPLNHLKCLLFYLRKERECNQQTLTNCSHLYLVVEKLTLHKSQSKTGFSSSHVSKQNLMWKNNQTMHKFNDLIRDNNKNYSLQEDLNLFSSTHASNYYYSSY